MLSDIDKAKVFAAIKSMESDLGSVYIKTLRGSIKELIVKKYRVIFFLKEKNIYIVSGFVKKSKKTPKNEIEYALSIYTHLK